MPKIKINEYNGRPATSSVWLEDGKRLEQGQTADVPDLAPFQALIDRNVLVTVAGRPKGKADAAATDPG